ncbi:MAG: TlpA disulfide reductase family protein [Bacillota bacterium]
MKHTRLSLLLALALLLALFAGASLSGCTPGEGNNRGGGAGKEVPPQAAPREQVSPEEAPRIGFRAPAFSLPALSGGKQSLEDYAGSALIINFWTTWCRYCVDEMPLLQELHDSAAGVVVLAVNVQEKQEVVESFINSAGYTFPVLLDEEARAAGAYLVRGLPTTFAVNARGVITAVRVGAFDAKGLAALVESALE